MHLSKIKVEGFRNLNHEFNMSFDKGLNVIVGENGAGKTAIVNAIRQLFIDSESGRYSITDDDFYCSFTKNAKSATSISISAEFSALNDDEKVAFLPWTGDSDTALLNLQVDNKEFRGRFKKVMWGGDSSSSQFDPELVDLIQCIYLPPLRDAESKLKNGRQSRLSKLLKAINRKELNQCRKSQKLHPLEERVKSFNDTLATDDNLSIKSANQMISEQLKSAIGGHFGQSTRIQFAETDFTKIVESLTLLFFPTLSPEDEDLFRGLNQNSLGYNNLLYIASILAELTLDVADEDDSPLFKLLLIEEPEAHLHPQLQIRLLNHIKAVADNAKNDVQVIVTTHSTVLASSVEIDSIIHLSKSRTPVATPLKECDLPRSSKLFINRWLDVTKSNLLFASGVILVEGIAEQMLIPVLAKDVLKPYKEGKQTLEEQGVSVINMNGIYFKHFIRLYCNLKGLNNEKDQCGKNIPVKCAGITDRDPPEYITNESEKQVLFLPHDNNVEEGTNHALKLVDTISRSDNARLFVSKYKTLEYDLAMEGNNAAIMAGILAELWPKPISGRSSVISTLNDIKGEDWSKKKSADKAIVAHEILKRIDNENIGKGFFAQVLADKLAKSETSLSIPEYLKNAVLWACALEEKKG